MKILIAEDDKSSRILLEKLTQKMGHETISTSNGREALKAFKENEIDIAILDWMMPEMDGIELCIKIRELEEGTDTPTYIFMVTSRSKAKDMVQALTIGVDDFLTKPVDRHMLEQRIEMGLKYQDFQKNINKLTHTPHLILIEEHNNFRNLIHIFDIIHDELENGVSEKLLEWSVSTMATLLLNLHFEKEKLYFLSFYNPMSLQQLDWFGEASEIPFVVITEEHKEIELSMMDLMGDISQYILGDISPADTLKLSIKSFTGLLLRHMNKEEKILFPFTLKYLSDDDMLKFKAEFRQKDKIFGQKIIDIKNYEIAKVLNLITENEENIRTWRSTE